MATESCTLSSESGLFDTPVTLKMLEKTLQEGLKTSATFGPNVIAKQIAFGQGGVSVMIRLTPDWQGNKVEELPTTFAVKIPTSTISKKLNEKVDLDEKLKDNQTDDAKCSADDYVDTITEFLKVAHAAEASFYKMVNQEQLKVKVPKCYFAQNYGSLGENGFLIMENLSDIAAIKPIYEGLSIKAAKQILENLAELHAYSLLHNEWLSNENLKSTYSKFQKQSGDSYTGLIIGMTDSLKKDHASLFDPLIDRLRESFLKDFNLEYLDTLHEQLGLPPVLTHGDIWMNNLMWQKAADGKGTTDQLMAIIDWQIVHPGCVGEDFVRMMCSSMHPDVRREHLTDFMEFYHASLKSKLGREPPFTVAQIIYAYKRIFRYGVAVLLPLFVGYMQPKLGMMGGSEEEIEKNRNTMLHQIKCLIEDLYAYEDELAGSK